LVPISIAFVPNSVVFIHFNDKVQIALTTPHQSFFESSVFHFLCFSLLMLVHWAAELGREVLSLTKENCFVISMFFGCDLNNAVIGLGW